MEKEVKGREGRKRGRKEGRKEGRAGRREGGRKEGICKFLVGRCLLSSFAHHQ
jgi:hypothetical protein